jgi:hypothetical protein
VREAGLTINIGIDRAVNGTTNAINSVANGEATVRLPAGGRGELGSDVDTAAQPLVHSGMPHASLDQLLWHA